MSAQHSNIQPRALSTLYFRSSRESGLIPVIVREQIRMLIEQNDLPMASELLVEFVEIYAQKRMNEAILLRRGISDIEMATRMNTLEFGVISRERNRLSLAILDLVDSVCS